jgi:LacI family transcriptional regulator
MKQRHTIKDVAQLAGVSVGTVSNVLNRKPFVAQKTIAKVKAVARELDYHPSLAARNLRSRKSNVVSLHLVYLNEGDMSQSLWDFYFPIIMGFTRSLKRRGLKLHLEFNRLEDLMDQEILMEIIHSHGSRGAAFVIPNQEEFKDKIKLGKVRIPIVTLFSFIDENVPSLQVDNVNAVYNTVKWLQHLGHEKISYISGRRHDCTAIEREEGYRAAMKSRGTLDILNGDWTVSGGIQCIETIVRRGSLPSAICCANDFMAMGVLRICHDYHIKIPSEISVVGFDDNIMCQVSDPQLTSMKMPLEMIGLQGADILIDYEVSGEIRHDILPAKLIKRNSVQERSKPVLQSIS